MARVGVRDSSGRFAETFEVYAKLPGTGTLAPIPGVSHGTTVARLGSLVELACGVPSDLQRLSFPAGRRAPRPRPGASPTASSALADAATAAAGDTLGDLRVLPGARVLVAVAPGFEGLVDAALVGDMKAVLMHVAATANAKAMARRRFVAMFIAAQKGYHFLVDRMLCDGADPDARTPSGRSAVHVACALGNGGCLDSLLQHGASLELRDAAGETPADAAASCGQRAVQRRLLLHARILANRVAREKPCSWPTSPGFPKSRLGSSVCPTLSLRDLAISPGPELMITNWKGREHHHQFLRPRSAGSARSSLFRSDSSSSSTESWSSLKDRSSTEQHPVLQSTLESSPKESPSDSASPQPPGGPDPISARSVRLHRRPKSAASPAAGRPGSAARGPAGKSVKFAFHEQSAVCASAGPTHTKSNQYSTQGSSSPGQCDDNVVYQKDGIVCETTSAIERNQERSSKGRSETASLSGRSGPAEKTDGSFRGDAEADEEYESSDASDEQPAQDLDSMGGEGGIRVNYLNDKLRDSVDLPVRDRRRLESMGEGGEKAVRSSFPTDGTRRPTPEENERAFRDWLASKSLDARDRRLVNKVGKMLDEAFSRPDETLAVGERQAEEERARRRRRLLKFEAWSERKAAQEGRQSARLAEATVRQERRKEEQLQARLAGGTTVEGWLVEKVRLQRKERHAEKQRETDRQRQKAEQERAAQDVFKKWCMQKEWEELQMLKGKPSSRTKRRPKSGLGARVGAKGAPTPPRRARAHSAPPRR